MVAEKSLPTSTLLFRREVFGRILFDERFYRHQDVEFLANYYRFFKMAVAPFFDVVMQIESFRNYPKGTNIRKIKDLLLEKFASEISSLGDKQQKAVKEFHKANAQKMRWQTTRIYAECKKLAAVLLGSIKYRKFRNMEKYWEKHA
jgi:hypothetical protein